MLAKDSDLLERRGRLITGVIREIESIREMTMQVKRTADKDGYV